MKKYFNREADTYTRAMIQLFEDIVITDPKTNEVIYNLPIVYGDYNKYSIARKYMEEKGVDLLSSYDAAPIAALRLTGMTFNPTDDKINTVSMSVSKSETLGKIFSYRTPIELTYGYNLTLWARSFEHLNQIASQLVPYVVRPFSFPVQDFIDIPGIERMIYVKLTSNSFDVTHESSQNNNMADNYKTIEISMDFELSGVMHFPVSANETQIEKITVEVKNAEDNKGVVSANAESLAEYLDIIEADRIERLEDNGAFIKNNGVVDVLNYITNPEHDMIYDIEEHPDVATE